MVALKNADLGDLLRKAVLMGLIFDEVYKSFDILEPSLFISHSDKIRYLLLHVYEGLERNPGQCILWHEVLCEHGMLTPMEAKVALLMHNIGMLMASTFSLTNCLTGLSLFSR